MSDNTGLVLLLADAEQRHAAIEVVNINATAIELAVIATAVSERFGYAMAIIVVLSVQDHPRAVAQARRLLRFSDVELAV
jgi:hypothetical protein